MKLDWKKTFLIGNGFLGIMVIWQIYNAFVPIFLQTGHPGFAPLMMGSVIDLFGSNFRTIFLTGPAFFLLGLIAMTLVTRGEAHSAIPATIE
jgi:hypothetical protein